MFSYFSYISLLYVLIFCRSIEVEFLNPWSDLSFRLRFSAWRCFSGVLSFLHFLFLLSFPCSFSIFSIFSTFLDSDDAGWPELEVTDFFVEQGSPNPFLSGNLALIGHPQLQSLQMTAAPDLPVSPEFLTETVRPLCASPLEMATLEQAGFGEKMLKVNNRLMEIKRNQDKMGIPLVRAFIECNPANGLAEITRLHAEKQISFQTHKEAPAVCMQFLSQFENAIGGPGGSGTEVKEHFLAGMGVANSLQLLRSEEFRAHKEDNTEESMTARTAGILLTILFNISTLPSLLPRLRSDLRTNNFIDALTPFGESKYAIIAFVFGRITC